MKKRILILLVLMAMSLMLAGSAPALADSPGKITGGFQSKDFFVVERGWFNFNVHEVDDIGVAHGSCNWKEYKEDEGWRRVQTHPVCVAFGQYDNQPAATVVVQIDRRTGWGEGNPGGYMKFWLLDGGTPGSDGDQWTTVGLGPWPPTEDLDDYGCGSEEPVFPPPPFPVQAPFPLDGGNLLIHQ